jgi:integrase
MAEEKPKAIQISIPLEELEIFVKELIAPLEAKIEELRIALAALEERIEREAVPLKMGKARETRPKREIKQRSLLEVVGITKEGLPEIRYGSSLRYQGTLLEISKMPQILQKVELKPRVMLGLLLVMPPKELSRLKCRELSELLVPQIIARDLKDYIKEIEGQTYLFETGQGRPLGQEYFNTLIKRALEGLGFQRTTVTLLRYSLVWQMIKDGCGPRLVNKIAKLSKIDCLKSLYEMAGQPWEIEPLNPSLEELQRAVDRALAPPSLPKLALPPEPLSMLEIQKILFRLVSQSGSIKERIGVGFALLRRPKELVTLKVKDIDLRDMVCQIGQDKVPLPGFLARLLEEYIDKEEDWLFPSQQIRLEGKHHHMTPQSLKWWISKLAQEAEVEVLPSQLYLHFGVWLIKIGELGARALQRIIGVNDIEALRPLYDLAEAPFLVEDPEMVPSLDRIREVMEEVIEKILTAKFSSPSPLKKRVVLETGTEVMSGKELKTLFLSVGELEDLQGQLAFKMAFSPLPTRELFSLNLERMRNGCVICRPPSFFESLGLGNNDLLIPLPSGAVELISSKGSDQLLLFGLRNQNLQELIERELRKIGLNLVVTPNFLQDQCLACLARRLASPVKMAVISGIAQTGIRICYFEPQKITPRVFSGNLNQDRIIKEAVELLDEIVGG